MRNFISALGLFALLLAVGSVAQAKGGAHPQNHHCVKDGEQMTDKTKKECKKAGGKWEKDAAPAAAGKPAGDDAKPAPAGDAK